MRLADTVAAALLARLPRDAGAAVCRRGDHTVVGVDPDEVVVANGSVGLAALDTLAAGFWVGWCAFELGHALERVVPRAASLDEASVPDVVFARFGVLASVGPDGSVVVRGDGVGRRLLERALLDFDLEPCAAGRRPPRAASGARVSIATTSKRASRRFSTCSERATATR